MSEGEFDGLVAAIKKAVAEQVTEVSQTLRSLKPAQRTDPDALASLAETHGDRMARTVLRFVTEKLSEVTRCPTCDSEGM